MRKKKECVDIFDDGEALKTTEEVSTGQAKVENTGQLKPVLEQITFDCDDEL